MFKNVIYIGIDGLGIAFNSENSNTPNLFNLFNSGSLKQVDANLPTDSAENWGRSNSK